jgi:Tfp pilus assembly protein PilO
VKLGTQVWGVIAFVVSVGVLAAGWFLGASPLLAAQAQAEQQRVEAAAQNDAIAQRIATLKEQKDDLASYEKRAGELEMIIPSDVEAADFIRSLTDLATASNVQVESMIIDDAMPYVLPSGDEADAVNAPNPLTDPRITGDNFLLVPVTVIVTGGWNEVLAFTHGVQTDERLVLVTTVNTANESGSFTTTLSGAMYVLIRPADPSAAVGGDGAADSESSQG